MASTAELLNFPPEVLRLIRQQHHVELLVDNAKAPSSAKTVPVTNDPLPPLRPCSSFRMYRLQRRRRRKKLSISPPYIAGNSPSKQKRSLSPTPPSKSRGKFHHRTTTLSPPPPKFFEKIKLPASNIAAFEDNTVSTLPKMPVRRISIDRPAALNLGGGMKFDFISQMMNSLDMCDFDESCSEDDESPDEKQDTFGGNDRKTDVGANPKSPIRKANSLDLLDIQFSSDEEDGSAEEKVDTSIRNGRRKSEENDLKLQMFRKLNSLDLLELQFSSDEEDELDDQAAQCVRPSSLREKKDPESSPRQPIRQTSLNKEPAEDEFDVGDLVNLSALNDIRKEDIRKEDSDDEDESMDQCVRTLNWKALSLEKCPKQPIRQTSISESFDDGLNEGDVISSAVLGDCGEDENDEEDDDRMEECVRPANLRASRNPSNSPRQPVRQTSVTNESIEEGSNKSGKISPLTLNNPGKSSPTNIDPSCEYENVCTNSPKKPIRRPSDQKTLTMEEDLSGDWLAALGDCE